MSKISDRQLAIFKTIKQEGEMKRSDIISRFKHWYYYNADKHIGDMLYRMVKSGSLIKTRRGYYGIGDSSPRPLPTNKTNPNRVSDNPNQLSII